MMMRRVATERMTPIFILGPQLDQTAREITGRLQVIIQQENAEAHAAMRTR